MSQTEASEAAAFETRPYGQYWQFFWPLAIMGVVNLAGRMAQNYTLLDFPNGIRELATFSLAMSIYWPISGVIAFLPQFSAVMIKGFRSLRSALIFVALICLAIEACLAWMAFSSSGRFLIETIFRTAPTVTDDIQDYLALLMLAPVFTAYSQLYMGIVVKARKTFTATLNRSITLGVTILVLAVGLSQGYPPKYVLVASVALPDLASLLLMFGAYLKKARNITAASDDPRPFSELYRFYWPMALTTIMFTLSRPIIFYLVSQQASLSEDEKALYISALTLSFTFGLLFQFAINQFRHVSVTFSEDDPIRVRNFMIQSTILITLGILVAQITPFSSLFLAYAQGAEGELLRMSYLAIWPMVLIPPIVAWRNFHHGIAMNRRQTKVMGVSAIARNVMIYLVGIALMAFGWFNVVSAASLMIVGFATEGLLATLVVRKWQRG